MPSKRKADTESDLSESDASDAEVSNGEVSEDNGSDDDDDDDYSDEVSEDEPPPKKKQRGTPSKPSKPIIKKSSKAAPPTAILPDTYPFLSTITLPQNNNREWMFEHSDRWTAIKTHFINFIARVLPQLRDFHEAIPDAPAKLFIFRINRDIRISASFPKGKMMDDHPACFYLHIQPGGSFLAGGIWDAGAEMLQKIRRRIADDVAPLRVVLEGEEFKEHFGDSFFKAETLKDHANIKYLKLKSFTVKKKVSEEETLSENFLDTVIETFRVMHPFIELMNDFATT
ncbi:hypothetical protein BC829DRAFT_408692 [Chytridium lagenaria]|nr:hypothetical protein BC829DRAFT_408692 [Chytridium lagenaria]